MSISSTMIDCYSACFSHFTRVSSDHRCSGGDAQEGERAGRSQEEAGHDPTAAVQVPAVRAQRGWTGSVSRTRD